jgi:hypothetical protein
MAVDETSMRNLPVLLVLLATSSAILGCASRAEDTDDFTTKAALLKTVPLAFGCEYVRHHQSGYGTYYEDTRTPQCDEGTRCDELSTPSDGYGYAAGNEYTSSDTNEHAVTFQGTCEKHEPVDPSSSSICDVAPVLCARDPNCLAILDCAARCGTERDCSSSCFANGEPGASNNAIATTHCARKD